MSNVIDGFDYNDPDCLNFGKRIFWEPVPEDSVLISSEGESNANLVDRITLRLISQSESVVKIEINLREVIFRTYRIEGNKWFIFTYFSNLDGVHTPNPYGIDLSITLKNETIDSLLSAWVTMSLFDPLSILNE
jgi:hypothetical protein